MTDPRHHDASPMLVFVLGFMTLMFTFWTFSLVRAEECKTQIVNNEMNWTEAIKEWQKKLEKDIAESRRREEMMGEKIQTLDYQIDVLTEQLNHKESK